MRRTRYSTVLSGIFVLLLVASLFVPIVHADSHEDGEPPDETESYRIVQGDQEIPVDPISGDEPVEEFYGYHHPYVGDEDDPLWGRSFSSEGTVEYQEDNTSVLMLYEGPEGVSLVAVHDKYHEEQAEGTNGSSVSWQLRGLPDEGEWAVIDDEYGWLTDNETKDDISYLDEDHRAGAPGNDGEPAEDVDAMLSWVWLTGRTDGVAYRGLGNNASVTIEPAFNEDSFHRYGDTRRDDDELNNPDAGERYNGTIDNWQVIVPTEDGEGFDRVSLESLDETVRIESIEPDDDDETTEEPEAAVSGPDEAVVNESVEFTANETTGEIDSYEWSVDSSVIETTTDPSVTHNFAETGSTTVSLTVTTADNQTDTDSVDIEIAADTDDGDDGDDGNNDDSDDGDDGEGGSSGGSGGGGSSSGGGGGGSSSSGGGGGSSGGGGGFIGSSDSGDTSDTEVEESQFDRESATEATVTDDETGISLTAPDANSGETVIASLTDTEIPDGYVDLETVQFETTTGSVDAELGIGTAAEDVPGQLPNSGFTATVDTSADTVRYQFSVDREQIDTHDIEPSELTVYQSTADGWESQSTRLTDRTNSTATVEATAPANRTVSVGATGPVVVASELTASTEPVAGEGANLTITAENVGTANGSRTIRVETAAGTERRAVSLSPGETESLPLNHTFDETETETVMIDGIDHTITPPNMALRGVSLVNDTIDPGETARLEARLENTGSSDGTYNVSFRVADSELQTETVTIAAGEERTVEFGQRFDDAGTYELGVGDEQTTLTVGDVDTTAASDSATPDGTDDEVPGFGPVAVLIALCAVTVAAKRQAGL